MTLRHFLTLAMAVFFALSPLPAGPSVLGSVDAAVHAHLNTSAVTAGATVYDGDRFSTESGGMLRVRSGATILELAEASVVNVRSQANSVQGMEAVLGKGTLVFSAARAASLNVIAREASFRPAADTRTVAQITVIGPKELRVRAAQGALLFTYGGESETMAERKSYRVILDPPEKNPKRPPKGFKIVIIGEIAAITALGIHEVLEPESPDRP